MCYHISYNGRNELWDNKKHETALTGFPNIKRHINNICVFQNWDLNTWSIYKQIKCSFDYFQMSILKLYLEKKCNVSHYLWIQPLTLMTLPILSINSLWHFICHEKHIFSLNISYLDMFSIKSYHFHSMFALR